MGLRTDSTSPRAGEARARIPWHALSVTEILQELGIGEPGLDDEGAAAARARFGPNELPRARPESVRALLARQLAQPLIYVLLAATVGTALLNQWIDAGVILAVVVVAAVIGFLQELRATREIEAMVGLVAHECTIARAGRPRRVGAAEVVPGDVLIVRPGDKIAADARLLGARGLLVDESVLTGESVPVAKGPAERLSAQAPLPERPAMLYAGTLVQAGEGRALVVATAAATELGRVAELVESAKPLTTPLTRQVAEFSRVLSVVIVAGAGLLFALALARGYAAVDALLAAVALAVSGIPEGLPAIMTIALAVGVQRMARRNAIIRHLPVAEALGSVTVVCSDKTGTLTRNEMVAVELRTPRRVELSGTGYAPEGELRVDGHVLSEVPGDVRELLEAGVLCSDAHLVHDASGWSVHGDTTEGALLVAAAKAGIDAGSLRAEHPRLDAVPFDPTRRIMATLHLGEGEGQARVLLKGAPEAVAARLGSGRDAWDVPHVLAAAADMAERGLRVIAVAARLEPRLAESLDDEGFAGGFRLLGLVGLLDPVREEAIRAGDACRRAGVRPVMVTGDHPSTALAVARRVGIASETERALTGQDIERMGAAPLARAAQSTPVFARVAPEHKLRLVQALQGRGQTVAMTGDGVNDAPALRQADVGVAMGLTGTDAAKEAAQVVLRDDNFASIEAAIEEGRRVYDNLVKSIVFILPTNAGEALLIVLAIALGLALPILPIHVLWINLVTTVALALPLAAEAIEPDAMRRPPRARGEPVLGPLAIERIALVGVIMFAVGIGAFEYARARGLTDDEARTTVVATVVLLEAFYLLSCRSLRHSVREIGLLGNPAVYAGIVLVVGLQVAFTYAPFMNDLFESRPIGVEEWAAAALGAALVVPAVAVEKRVRRRRGDAVAAQRAKPTG